MIKLELGAGDRRMPGWTGLDKTFMAEIRCDLEKESLPFEDSSVDEIYSSHFLEHFYHKDLVGHVLPECLRVLKPGCQFRIAVPDASIYVKAYMDGANCPEVIPIYKKAYFYHSPLDSINYIAYMGGDHKHMFDMENLLAILEDCGFDDVREREFDPDIDVQKRKAQSIFVVAHKPLYDIK